MMGKMEKVRGTLLKPTAETTSLYLGAGGSLYKEVELPDSRSWGETLSSFISEGEPKPRKVK